jgi:hypothetical protein
MSNQDTEFMRTTEAARYLRVSHAFLETARCEGKGPLFVKLGRVVVYRKADLDAFAEGCVRTSTSTAA